MGGLVTCCCPGDGGYKHVVSAVRWLGGEHPYGYLTPSENSTTNTCADQDWDWWLADPCPGSVCSGYIAYSPDPPDHKYLGLQIEIEWNHVETRVVTCGTCTPIDTVWNFNFRRSRDTHTDRFSGLGTVDEITTWDEVYVDNVTSANSYESHLTGIDAWNKFNTMTPPYTGIDAACGHVDPPEPGGDALWQKITQDVTDNSIDVYCEMSDVAVTNNSCTCDGNPFTDTDTLTKIGDFHINALLHDKFTSAELYQYGKNLLALWDLGDHTHYPWRTTCAGDAYHLGALVTFDYGGTGSAIGGPFTGETWSVGAHALLGYSAEGMSGGSVWFNNQENVWGYTNDYLVLGKWAEKKVTLLSHNYARPCGVDHWSKVDTSYESDLCWPPGSTVNKLVCDGTNPADGDQVSISTQDFLTSTTYTFRTTPGALPEIQIGADATASMLNLKNGINAYPDPLVTATVSGLEITVTGAGATRAYHFYLCSTSVTTMLWDYDQMVGPVCVNPCNNTTSTGDYTTLERTWPKRANAEASRMNGMAALCPGGAPCSDAYAYTVLPDYDNTCAQENASAGTILYCSPNAEDFGADPTEQTGTWPANALPIGDDKYGYLWQFHIRQVMPDPLIDCQGNPLLLEESRCSVPGGCPALPAGAVFYCDNADDTGCGFQDDYGIQCPPL
jgi:hypothetical protein